MNTFWLLRSLRQITPTTTTKTTNFHNIHFEQEYLLSIVPKFAHIIGNEIIKIHKYAAIARNTFIWQITSQSVEFRSATA